MKIWVYEVFQPENYVPKMESGRALFTCGRLPSFKKTLCIHQDCGEKNSLGASGGLKQLLIQQQNLFTDHTFDVKPKLTFHRIPLFGTFCKLFCAWHR